MCDSLIAPIDNFMLWRVNGWKKLECSEFNLTLRVHCNQLLITSESNILESIDMTEKVKGIFKEDILILYVRRTAQDVRKFKFRIKSNAHQCFEELSKYFSVICHDSKYSKSFITPRFKNVEEVLTRALTITKEKDTTGSSLPPSFKNFIRLCLLDPSFPKLVEETQSILNNKFNVK